MNPAFSVIAFTTIAGAAQGLVVTLAVAMLAGSPFSPGFQRTALLLAAAMLVAGLGASFLHLGRPERAWRAATMWRTSWLSREVIVLPAFIAVVGLGWLGGVGSPVAPLWHVLWSLLALVVAALLWYCTAMIYACLRFIEEWAHPLTVLNFVLIGMASGLLLCAALVVFTGEPARPAVTWAALVATLLAWAGRRRAVHRNAGIRHRSTLQTATGIHVPKLEQKSMGMSAGSFNTREFFHTATASGLRHVKRIAELGAFALPALLLVVGLLTGAAWAWALALALQAVGLVADRWLFFAQAKHPQNLYYQVVS